MADAKNIKDAAGTDSNQRTARPKSVRPKKAEPRPLTEAEKDKEIARLNRKVKKLEKELCLVQHYSLDDIIKLCSSCKKVLDPNGQWIDLEQYLEAKTKARCSHGLCPFCAKTIYADDFF